MIKFKMSEIPPQVPGFHGKMMRRRDLAQRGLPQGERTAVGKHPDPPPLTLYLNTEQEEETDQWVAFVHWELMDFDGWFPCREGSRGEVISKNDPPERFKTEQAAELFGRKCEAKFSEQFDEWITGAQPHEPHREPIE